MIKIKDIQGDFKLVYELIKPLTAYGKEKHDTFEFYQRGQEDELNSYFYEIQKAINFIQRNDSKYTVLKRLLKQVKNIDLYLSEIVNNQTTEIALFELNKSVNILVKVIEIIKELKINKLKSTDISLVFSIKDILKAGNKDGGFYLSSQYNENLQTIRGRLRDCDRELVKESKLNSKDISEILQRDINTTFSVSKHNKSLVTQLLNHSKIDIESQTEYVYKFRVKSTQRIKELKKQRENLNNQLQRELQITKEILALTLSPLLKPYLRVLHLIGELDVTIARAKVSIDIDATIPKIVATNIFNLHEGSHPLLNKKLKLSGKKFTPRTILLKPGVSLISGVNMGGKTVTLRLIELLTLMTHAAMPVPAKSLEIGLRDYVHFSRSDEDSILTGLSHFGQEITEIVNILKHDKELGLVLIDEIAHGTTPVAGESIASAILEKLHKSNSLVVVTTHYTGISEIVPVYEYQIKGLNYDKWQKKRKLSPDKIQMDFSDCIDFNIEPVDIGNKTGSEAIKIAEILGLDIKIIKRAKELEKQTLIEKAHAKEVFRHE